MPFTETAIPPSPRNLEEAQGFDQRPDNFIVVKSLMVELHGEVGIIFSVKQVETALAEPGHLPIPGLDAKSDHDD